ncbi:MAG: hypothetical protein ABW049_13430 [Spongiibacteraceae bacterium]
MRTFRRFFAPLLLPLLLAGCPSEQPRFVKPVATPVDAEKFNGTTSKYQDGYLRIFVSSNLDSTGKIMDFGKEGENRPAMLLISTKFGKGTVASFSADADPEIPVLLYDVRSGKTQSSVVNNALLTEGMLIDPESLSRSPHLQIFVRGVPADKATWVTDLLELATDEPILKVGLNFVPGGAAFSPLSTKLGNMLSEEIKTTNKPWEEKTLLGLRTDEGLAALHGRQFVVLLNPSTIALEAPPKLLRCDTRGSLTGLCEGDGKPWIPKQAYVRFELNVTDFRSIKDFINLATSCEADDRVWSDYRVLLASGQLARRQTEYERHLLARGELLMQIRRSQAEYTSARYVSRLLLHAQQYALLPTPNDAYWNEHFADRAKPMNDCLRHTAVRGRTTYATTWDTAVGLYTRSSQYPVWATAIAASDDANSAPLQEAEKELVAVRRLLATGDLKTQDATSLKSLTHLSAQLESMLEAGYLRIARNIEADTATLADTRINQLTALAERTACDSCKNLLAQKAEAVRAAATPSPSPSPSPYPSPSPTETLPATPTLHEPAAAHPTAPSTVPATVETSATPT